MHFTQGKLYHIYNRGINKQTVFYTDSNYLSFLKKIQDHLVPICDVLAYCLMPNHFHFLIHANEKSIVKPLKSRICKTELSESFRIMLSSYANGLNKQEKRTGSLFTQNTRSKAVQDWSSNLNYAEVCFNYIHKNPISSNIVTKLNDWPYSSFYEYTGTPVLKICNIDLAKELLDIDYEYLGKYLADVDIKKDDKKMIF